MNTAHAELVCETCDQVTDHELHYAGRLLESVRCTRCGSHMELSQRALLPAYVHDLEQRVASKPRRLWHRAARERGHFLRGLPRAIVRQPRKFLEELRTIVRR